MTDDIAPQSVLELFAIEADSITPIDAGLINRSFAVRRLDGTAGVLQRVNAIFPPAINDDIDAVTRHLKSRGLVTPILLRATDDRPYIEVDGTVWRLLSRIPGATVESLGTDAEAREAGRVLGRFHAALDDFTAPLAGARPPVHELARHLDALRRTLSSRSGHPMHGDVARLAETIFARGARLAQANPEPAQLAPADAQPARLVHGDPKISNVVFDRGRAVCLVDLDTIARMPIALELGDALRSWCNPSGEDSPEACFSIEQCRAALEGYRLGAADLLTAAEWRAVPDAALSIAVELAARFAADALNESYFGWDRGRFASAGEHNLARADAQIRLADSIRRAMPGLHAIVAAPEP